MLLVGLINFSIGLLWAVVARWLYANIYPAHEVLLLYEKPNTAPLELELERQKDRYHLKTKMSLEEGREKITREILRHRVCDAGGYGHRRESLLYPFLL